MEAFQSAVGALQQDLKLITPGAEMGDVAYQINRLRIMFDGGSKAKGLLDELAQRNQQLQRLLKSTDKVAQLSQQRNQTLLTGISARLDSVVLTFWKKATGLYWALQDTWGGCSCSKIHMTHMRLEHHTAHQEHQYDVMFATSESEACWKPRRTSLVLADTEIQAIAAPKMCDNVPQINVPIPDSAAEKSKKTDDCLARERRLKSRGKERLGDTGEPRAKVKIACANGPPGQPAVLMASPAPMTKQAVKGKARAESPPPSTSRKSTSHMTPPTTQTREQSTLQAVFLSSGQYALQYKCEDEDYNYYVYPEPEEIVVGSDFVTLHQLISEDRLPPLKFRERLLISLSLAWPFLKLLDSPWIPHYWTTEDIIFLPDAKEPQLLNLEKPYVKGRRSLDEDEDRGNSSLALEANRQASLNRLGVVLEELCFRCSIEKRRAWQLGHHQQPGVKGKQEQLDTDVLVGINWLRDINKEAAGLEFSKVVKSGLFDNRLLASGSDSDSWRREMLTHVVWPLERSCQQLPK
ncbi:hypothetical protein RB595_004088 [Gaeumannomyces hyphopodioides]